MQEPRQTAEEIAESNATAALDFPMDDYETPLAQIAAYAVNVVDTCREYEVSAEKGLERFLALVTRPTLK
jgi:hypothetical protein